MKVVSLLPSATEIVALVGGEHLLVGRSHECNYPPSVEQLPALTAAKTSFVNSKQMNDAVVATLASGSGLYVIDEALLKKLNPDVIVTQSVCAVCSVDFQTVNEIASRMAKKPKIVDLNPQSLEDVFDGCRDVGMALGMEMEAASAVRDLQDRRDRAMQYVSANALIHPPKARRHA